MKAMLSMLFALHSYKQLCFQTKALLLMRLPSRSGVGRSLSCRTWARFQTHCTTSQKSIMIVPRGGYYNSNTDGSNVPITTRSFASTTSGNPAETSNHQTHNIEPIVSDYSEISGKLKAAKFGDRSYLSTADVVASQQHRVVFILGGPGKLIPFCTMLRYHKIPILKYTLVFYV
jgi:hypothetical protein